MSEEKKVGRPKKTEEKIDRRITFLVKPTFYDEIDADRKNKNIPSMSAYIMAAIIEYMKKDDH